MAVLAPMPRARTKMAAMEKPGFRRRIRKENRKSESKFRIGRHLRAPQARPSAVTYITDELGWADVSMNLENGVSRETRGALPEVANRGTGGREGLTLPGAQTISPEQLSACYSQAPRTFPPNSSP